MITMCPLFKVSNNSSALYLITSSFSTENMSSGSVELASPGKLKMLTSRWAPVVHACNPSYLEG
jgi:hypothetical protein